MTDTEKELLDCLKDYIKKTETANVQEGIWFNKVYKDAKRLVKKLTIADVTQSCDTCKHLSNCRFWKEAPNNGETCKFYIEHVA